MEERLRFMLAARTSKIQKNWERQRQLERENSKIIAEIMTLCVQNKEDGEAWLQKAGIL